MPELEDRRLILRPLLAEWTNTNAAAAADFARQPPAGVERSEFIETVIREWAGNDAAAAGAWLSTLEPHDDVDAATSAFATNERLIARYPAMAARWAESIGAPALRIEVLSAVTMEWARRDLAAAERYVADCPTLTAAERAHVLARMRRWSGPTE